MSNLLKYQRIIDKLPLVAKVAILSFILPLVFIIWYFGLWQDLSTSITTGSSEIKILENSIPELKFQLQTIENTIKLKQIQKNKDQSNASKLTSPQQKGEVLYKLISTTDNLTLLQLKNTPPKMITLPQSNLKISEHGIILKLQGDYFSTMHYLQAIEKSKWKIFWDKLEYKVTQYPNAEITLYLHTISDYEDLK